METYYCGHQSILLGCRSRYPYSTNIFGNDLWLWLVTLKISGELWSRHTYMQKKSRSKDSWFKWENGNGRTVTTIALPSPPTLNKYTYGPYIEIMRYINLLVTLTLTRVINVSYTQQWITQILCSLWRTFYEISTKNNCINRKIKT